MIVCIYWPRFVVQVECQNNPSLIQTPFLIFETMMTQQRVLAISEPLDRSGIKPKMLLRPAQALAPEAKVLSARPSLYHRRKTELLDLLTDFTSIIELEENEQDLQIYLDLGKQTMDNAISLTQQIGQNIRHTTALEPALGLASGIFPAYIAATSTCSNRLRYISHGNEATFLSKFSINTLPTDSDIKERLMLLGLYTLGQVADLSAKALFNQFGYEGRRIHRLSQGKDSRLIKPFQPEQIISITHQADDPLESRVILEANLQKLAINLSSQLKQQGQTGRQVYLALELENQRYQEQKHILSQPTNEPQALFQILKLLLNQCQIDRAVIEINVQIRGLAIIQGQQLDLFVHQNQQRQRLQDHLADMFVKHGTDTFIRPRLSDQTAYLSQHRFQLQTAVMP